MVKGEKSCCKPNGHCKSTAPASQEKTTRDCSQIAWDHQESPNLHMQPAVVTLLTIDSLLPGAQSPDRWRNMVRHAVSLIKPSPPDLQILNSIFVI